MFVLFLTNMTAIQSTTPVAYQFPLRPALPCIYGPQEYRDERDLYERVDGILHTSGIEREYVSAAFAEPGRDWSKAKAKAINQFALYASIGLRCAVSRSLTRLSLRGLTTRAADSTTLAWFLGTADIQSVKSPSKSTVHRLGEQVSEASLRRINELLVAAAIAPVRITAEGVSQPAGLEISVAFESIWFVTASATHHSGFPAATAAVRVASHFTGVRVVARAATWSGWAAARRGRTSLR